MSKECTVKKEANKQDENPKITKFQGDYRWLSNFQYCETTYKGLKYSTTENAYQAQKYDSEDWKDFCQKEKPSTVKRVANLLRENPYAFNDSIRLELVHNWHEENL